MLHFRQPSKSSLKALFLAVYLLGNGLVIALFSNDMTFDNQDPVKSSLCIGHLPLMTNVTPDIRC